MGWERDAFLARLRAEDPAMAADLATMLADVAQFAATTHEETFALDKLLGQVELRAA